MWFVCLLGCSGTPLAGEPPPRARIPISSSQHPIDDAAVEPVRPPDAALIGLDLPSLVTPIEMMYECMHKVGTTVTMDHATYDLDHDDVWTQHEVGEAGEEKPTHHKDAHTKIDAALHATLTLDLAAVLHGGPYAADPSGPGGGCALQLRTSGSMSPFFSIPRARGGNGGDPIDVLLRDLP